MTRNEYALRVAKFFRIITLAPVVAFFLVSKLFFGDPACFGGTKNYVFSIIFIVIFPLLGYPLQLIMPKFKGRENQRNLAILTAIIGYIFAVLYGFLFRVPKLLIIIFLTYFISGFGIIVSNKIFRIKASGHACGAVGSAVMCVYVSEISPMLCIINFCLISAVFWSSLKLARHNIWQLFLGSMVSVSSFLISIKIQILSNFLST
ncbi:MAG: hypothetical protein LBK29_01540 [Oscillospiraceae bacterium]|jgi:hypothetical protein|nr:hypothetical protein [Oscillospiraceae bacterium]